MKFAAVYCIYDDHEFLEASLSIAQHLDQVVFLMSDVPWNGRPSDNSRTIQTIKDICASYPSRYKMFTGHWTNEMDQRNFGLDYLISQGIDICFVIDSDEIYSDQHFLNIKKFIEVNPQFDAFLVEWNTYWTRQYYRIEPREHHHPLIAVRCQKFLFTFIRGGTTSITRVGNTVLRHSAPDRAGLIPQSLAICHHLSYVRDDAYMRRKLETNSHAPEFIPDWYEKVWKSWTPSSQNLHPVTPRQYRKAIPHPFPDMPPSMQQLIKRQRHPNRMCSIIILNWNSLDLLKRCLLLVGSCTTRKYEIIVVDNGSTDGSVEYLKTLPHKTVFNKTNLGFPAGVNSGIKVAGPDSDICLLNVDAEVTEGWLTELYNTLITMPETGMVGSLGNEVSSGYQAAGSQTTDTRQNNLLFYCVLISRELLDTIGVLDPIYGYGNWDDFDYSTRAKLAGFHIGLSHRSLVHHKPHQVFEKNGIDHQSIDAKNKEIFYAKFYSLLNEISQKVNLYGNRDFAKSTGLYIQ